ncbi:MAG: hypothetical protein C0480_13635 [Bradyrhizobium sp.]|jgi:hypothetical protein|nr:hypothetical protein [Bradyrhizobium sp.]
MSGELNRPDLAEAINATAIKPRHAEVALARRDDLLQFFGHFHGSRASYGGRKGVTNHPE